VFSHTRWPACWAYACPDSLPLDLCMFNCLQCICIHVDGKPSFVSLELNLDSHFVACDCINLKNWQKKTVIAQSLNFNCFTVIVCFYVQ